VPDLVVPVPAPPRAASLGAGSPKATRLTRARWRDARLLFGVLLVMTSVVAGSRVLAGADRTQQVWSVTADLAAGTRLTAADLQLRAARLDAAAGNYLLSRDPDPVGSLLVRAVSSGDLLPAAAISSGSSPVDDRPQVTVPVATFHYPADLTRGQLVDVYVTPDATSADPSTASTTGAAAAPELLIVGALVVTVEDSGSGFGGPSSSVGVVLCVPADQVAALVGGLRRGPVDLVQVPTS
jgi:hypothetical protein